MLPPQLNKPTAKVAGSEGLHAGLHLGERAFLGCNRLMARDVMTCDVRIKGCVYEDNT